MYTMGGLFAGTLYKFDIYGSSDCGQTATRSAYNTTDIMGKYVGFSGITFRWNG